MKEIVGKKITEKSRDTFFKMWQDIKKNVDSRVPDSSTDLIDEIILDERIEDFHWKIVLVGDGAVGKTSLRRRYLGESFSGNYQLTIGADFAVHEDKIGSKHVKFVIWDLAGQPRFHEVRSSFYRGCDGAMIVFDLTNPDSFKHLQYWMNEVWKNGTKGPVPFVVVANKADLRDLGLSSISDDVIKDFTTKLDKETRRRYSFGTKLIITSAKTGENVREAFKQLAIQLIAQIRYLEKKQPSES
ncbi:MAG: Rab family GTPase [Candidatus Thorarchaeota archaeon]